MNDIFIVSGSVTIVVVTLLGMELLSLAIRRAAKVAGASPTVIRDVREGTRVLAILIVISAILTFTGLASEFTALTISGIAGLAVSLALQTTLSNVISGILMLNDGVIHLGDSIEYSGIKGKVVRVALRNSWIQQEDGTIAVISNSSLSSGPLVNKTATERLKKKYAIS